jgi:hypothetical protein
MELCGKKGFRITGQASYLPMLLGIFVTTMVVSPTGSSSGCNPLVAGIEVIALVA